MTIRQPVKNTLDRIGIDYQALDKIEGQVEVKNRFGAGSCMTSPLIAECIAKVYAISNAYEYGNHTVTVADFDRLRYFILEVDKEAYYNCID